MLGTYCCKSESKTNLHYSLIAGLGPYPTIPQQLNTARSQVDQAYNNNVL